MPDRPVPSFRSLFNMLFKPTKARHERVHPPRAEKLTDHESLPYTYRRPLRHRTEKTKRRRPARRASRASRKRNRLRHPRSARVRE